MRKIKFRVWCEFEIEGKLIKEMAGPESWFLLEQNGGLMAHDPASGFLPNIAKRHKKLIPMLWTSLLDRQGKEIYEGDIVKWDDRSGGKYWRIAKVIFEKGMFGFEIIKAIPVDSCDVGYKFIGNFSYQDSTEIDLEIIGNIYENPELLEEKPK